MSNQLTHLNYLLLGLINNKPQSRYDLCQVIQHTPMSLLSHSPGSIYPAINKLAKLGYIEAIEQSKHVRNKKVFKIHESGRQVLIAWMMGDIESSQLINSPSIILVKLSFLDLLSKGQQALLLSNLKKQLDAEISHLSEYHNAAKPALLKGGSMAFDLALDMLKVQSKYLHNTDKIKNPKTT